MAKNKSKYVCQNCGYESTGYLGKCPECNSWATFVEEILNTDTKNSVIEIPDNNPPMKLSEIKMKGFMGSLGKKQGFVHLADTTVTGRIARLMKSGLLWYYKRQNDN